MEALYMPRAEAAMEKGLIVKWLKREGERVQEGEVLLEVEGEKATFEVRAPISGYLRQILRREGEEVAAGEVLGYIGGMEEPLPPPPGPRSEVEGEAIEKPGITSGRELRGLKEGVARIKISPAAKRLAEELGIDYSKLRGTGPEGRIVREDVLRAVGERRVEGIEVSKVKRSIELKGSRRLIAERLSRSWREKVPVLMSLEVRIDPLLKLRGELEAKEGVKPSITSFVVKAVALALKDHEIFNSTLTDERILIHESINVAIAVDTPQGLLAPVIRAPDGKGLLQLHREVEDLVRRAKEGRLGLQELEGSTFTVTNLGHLGVELFMPIINPPNSAILGVGGTQERVVREGEGFGVARVIRLCLVFDHRVTDGAPAALFLKKIKGLLEGPEVLL